MRLTGTNRWASRHLARIQRYMTVSSMVPIVVVSPALCNGALPPAPSSAGTWPVRVTSEGEHGLLGTTHALLWGGRKHSTRRTWSSSSLSSLFSCPHDTASSCSMERAYTAWVSLLGLARNSVRRMSHSNA